MTQFTMNVHTPNLMVQQLSVFLVLLNLPSQNQYLSIGIGELKNKNSPMLTSQKVDGANLSFSFGPTLYLICQLKPKSVSGE
jgi:hypothetical protein